MRFKQISSNQGHYTLKHTTASLPGRSGAENSTGFINKPPFSEKRLMFSSPEQFHFHKGSRHKMIIKPKLIED